MTARNEVEMEYLEELYEQGMKNKVQLEMISREDALKLEPTLDGFGDKVIHSPTTCVMDTPIALKTLTESLPSNVEMVYGASLLGTKRYGQATDCEITTATGSETIQTNFFVNAAGFDSLRVAQQNDVATDYVMLPLKGRYVISDKNVSDRYNMIVYPVPVKGAFNLGVHSTLTMDGRIKFGPTVFPAFSEANYDYL